MSVNQSPTNLQRACEAWGPTIPAWVRQLAAACDTTTQRAVAALLDKSGGYVSRIVNRKYEGSYSEAETLVRARIGGEGVNCPLFGEIPLASCIRNRRRKGRPVNAAHHLYARTCPACPNNSDGGEA
jgi:hypothetical protein